MALVVKKGTHGTSLTRANMIKASGVWYTSAGRAGTGAYFWAESPYAWALAVGWYREALEEGKFSRDANREGIVLFVNLTSDEKECLDLEDETLKNKMAELIIAKGPSGKVSDRRQAAFYDFFIRELEKDRKVKYALLRVKVAPPREVDYPLRVLGAPSCLVARSTNCITIVDRKEIAS